MKGGNRTFRGPKWGPLMTCVPPDSSQFSQDFTVSGHSFLSRANASPHQSPAWDMQSPRWRGQTCEQEVGDYDLQWVTPSPPGMSPRGHAQQQQRGLRNAQSIQGYGEQMPLGHLNGAGRRQTNPVPSVSPLNDMDQQERGRRPGVISSPESPSLSSSWGDGHGRKTGRFDQRGLLLEDEKIGLAERLATRVYNDLLAGNKGVSTGKVAQATLSALGVPSFETVGVKPQDIPCLRKLALLESKVNAFVHSHVAGKKITTLHDLSLDLTQDEGVKEFENLGLGPLLCHPLVGHYFSPPVGTEVHKITAREVIQHLSDYIGNVGKDTRVQIESFLAYVAKERSLPSPEHLCIRIQSLGMHIGFIRRSKKAEKELIGMWESQAKADFVNMKKPSVIERVNSFLAAERKKDASLGKRKFARFSSEASPGTDIDNDNHDQEDGVTKRSVLQNGTSRSKGRLEIRSLTTLTTVASTCPYPSAAEERARLKRQELQQFVANSEQEDFYLSSSELQEFVTLLKDACENRSVHEVLMKMIEVSRKFKGTKKRSGKSKIFKAYPAIGLLNVAVLSVKAGYWDSMYKNFLDATDESDGRLKDHIRSVQVATPTDIDSNPRQSTPCQASLLPVPEEIVAAVSEHYEQYLKPHITDENLHISQNQHRAWWLFLHWVYECENWIAGKYFVGAFASLGFGKFSYFLEKHMELLPCGILSIIDQQNRSRRVVAKVPKERVFSFLGQVVPVLREGETGPLFQDHISSLLCRQFKVSNIEELGANSVESLLETSKDEKAGSAPNTHVFFLEPLVASCAIEGTDEVHLFKESCSQVEVSEDFHESRVGVLGSMSCADATKCLSKAPFLADLSQWSQWHAVFAPALGPLLDWFEREGSRAGLHAILTSEGTLLRIDETATPESFLLATVKGCGDQMAAILMSLIALHGGTASTPTALLKAHASKGLEILLGASAGDLALQPSFSPPVVNTKRKLPGRFGEQAGRPGRTYKGGTLKAPAEPPTSGRSSLQANGNYEECVAERIGRKSCVASRCVIECLCCVIPELRIFTAQILLPAIARLMAGSPAVLLNNCTTLQQTSVLHSVGLSLGIPEWTNDFKRFAVGPTQLSAPQHISVSEDMEVDKSSQTTLTKELSNEFVSHKVRGSMVHTGKGDGNNKCQDVEMLTNDLSDSFQADQCRISPQHKVTDGSKEMGHASWKGHKREESNDMLDEKAPPEAQANMIIEEIRRYEFGVGQDIQGKDCDLLARQHARMGRALHRLSSDLYSQDSHFVLELVQNADDNAYNPGVDAALVFVIQEGCIVVLNNEIGFTESNIRALCDVGNSTKAASNTGYIGHKGIGFKSVFRVTNAPEIHSNGFHVKFDISKGDLGFILPTWIPPPAAGSSGDDLVTLMSEIELPKSVGECWNTCINLPIKESLHKKTRMSILTAKFNDLHPSLLLFLHRLRCIAVRNELMGSTVVMHREDCGEDLVKVVHETGTATWMVVRRQLKAVVHRPGITDTEIALAFQLNEVSTGRYEACSEQQQVFAFLPLRAYGLRFIVQGDFKVPSSREEVDCDSDWNQWLRSEIPDVFIKSAKAFHKTVASGNPGKAVSSFMSFVPMEGEVLGFFSPLPRMILSTLRGSPCLPVEGGGWTLPCVLLRGWSTSTRQLLPDMFLNEHLGLCYLDKDVMIPDILAKKLGVQQFGAGILVAVMKSICQKKGALEPLGLKWVEAWLLALHDCFESDRQSYHPRVYEDMCTSFILELKKLPYIPLWDGSFASLSDGSVWFAGELLENGLGVNNLLTKFVHLSSELRTIHSNLISLQNESCISEESAGVTSLPSLRQSGKSTFEKVVSILERLGVRRLSAHDVLKSHVLPAMAKDNCLSKDRLLVVEYLGFVMLHLESNCVICCSEKLNVMAQLQKCAVLVTSNGLIRAGQEPIHFNSLMGNNISDMRKIFEGFSVSWNEVSPLYLEMQASGCEATKCRSFFKELGVTDFVAVVKTEKKILDKNASIWKACAWEEGIALEGGWIVQDWQSPELEQLLLSINNSSSESAMEEGQKLHSCLREQCASILIALDSIWDDYYYQFCHASYSQLSDKGMAGQKSTQSSFLLLLQQCSWVISTLDKKLHVPADLFRSCDAVKSILGSNAPYVVPLIQSEGFMEALGFRTCVSVDDALQLLRHWIHSKGLFEASVAQMTRFYSFLWESLLSHKEDVLSVFRSLAAIFVPLHWNKNSVEVQRGRFYPVEQLCWNDPSKTVDLVTFDQEARRHLPVMPLGSIYEGLHEFFVRECLVLEKPTFDAYLEVLRKVAAEQVPRAVLSHVMEVFCLWSSEISAGNVEPSEILRWTRRLEEVESCIFATKQDKWVSLNHEAGLVCICDDENLGAEFEESSGPIHFILMTDDDLMKACSRNGYERTNQWTLQPLVQALCIPKLSEVVEREVIKCGLHDSAKIEALIGWVLPYAQRYLKHHHVNQYCYLQGIGITETLESLQFVVVDELYFQYRLRNSVIRSKKQTHCTCILEDSTLHVVENFLQDYCNIYVELSRLFFCGKSNLSLANFLHLITLMASSGSSVKEVEGFIQNMQGIQPIMGEDLWNLHKYSHLDSPENEGPSAGYYLERHVNQQNLRKKSTKGSITVGWPPNSWEPLSTREGVAASPDKIGQVRAKEGILHPSDNRLQVDRMSGSSTVGTIISNQIPMLEYKMLSGIEEGSDFKDNAAWDCEKRNVALKCGRTHMGIGDFRDVLSHKRSLYSVSMEEKICSTRASHCQEPQRQSLSQVSQVVGSSKVAPRQAMDMEEVVMDGSNAMVAENVNEVGPFTNFEDRDFLVTNSVNEKQRELTGRTGEALVFQYLSGQYGPTRVKWLNQESESGAAYDILVIKDSGQEEFVEVKATRSDGKDWFEISPREWDFARIHGESFTIMRVFLGPTTQQVRLLRLPNPVMLAQDHVLQLALLLPATQANNILQSE